MNRLTALALCVVGAGAAWLSASGWTRAVALMALAGVGALIAGRGLFRRIVAVVVILAGLGLTLDGTAVAIVGGVLVVAGGVIAVATCPAWPVMGSRYERAAEPAKTDLWAALDRGEDPTAN